MERDGFQAGAPLRTPAVALIVLSFVAIILDFAILNAVSTEALKLLRHEPTRRSRQEILVGAVANGGLLLIHAAVLSGSVHLFKLWSYRKARLAALVSLIPFCTPVVILGIPFAAWAIAVLRRDEVKAAFRAGPGCRAILAADS